MDNSLKDKNMFENMFGKNDNLLTDIANAMKVFDEPNGYYPPIPLSVNIEHMRKKVYDRLRKLSKK